MGHADERGDREYQSGRDPSPRQTGATGDHAYTRPTLSATAQADLTALKADQKTFAGEVAADTALTSLTAAVKADGKVIMTALSATPPGVASAPHVGKGREAGFHGFDKGNDPSIDLNGHGHPGFAPGGLLPPRPCPPT